MAKIWVQCPNCKRDIEVHIGDRFFRDEIWRHKSYDCAFCGWKEELDDTGRAPEAVRGAVMQEDGRWSLAITESGQTATKALKALRRVLGLSLTEVAEVGRHMPGEVFSGTRAEVEPIRSAQAAEGLPLWTFADKT
jgi:hypothetical protein